MVNDNHNHQSWVTKVRYSASAKNSYYASVGRDGWLRIWNGIFKLYASIKAHDNYINALALSTNGQYIATGGKDKTVKIWDFTNLKSPAQVYEAGSEVKALAFNTKYQWIAAALENKVVVWNLSNQDTTPHLEVTPSAIEGECKPPRCTSIAWSANSERLYVGCYDGAIRVYSIDFSS